VNGVAAASPAAAEDGRSLRWTVAPTAPWSGVVTMAVRASDGAGNVHDRQVGRFLVEGATLARGDIDRDGRVDGADLVFLGLAFGASGESIRYDADADLDGSGTVDGDDLAVLAANFGASFQ